MVPQSLKGDKKTMRKLLLSALVLAAVSSLTAQAAVTDSMIEQEAKTGKEVLSYGLGTRGQRFSPLTQINTKSIKTLAPAWSFSFGGEKQRGQESPMYSALI
eukprot:Opistho-1_new@9637